MLQALRKAARAINFANDAFFTVTHAGNRLRSAVLYTLWPIRLPYFRNRGLTCLGTGRAANAKDVASIYNELLFHSVDLGGYVCMPTRTSEASSFGSARKWRKRDLVGLQWVYIQFRASPFVTVLVTFWLSLACCALLSCFTRYGLQSLNWTGGFMFSNEAHL